MNGRIVFLLIGAFALGAGTVWFLGDKLKGSSTGGTGPSTQSSTPGSATTLTNVPTGENPSYTGTFGLQLDAHQRVANDPMEAIKLADTIKGREQRLIYLDGVWEAWGARDGAKAAGWAKDNLKGVNQSDALISISRGWASESPAETADWFLKNSSGLVLEDSMWEILAVWGQKNPREALAWSENLHDYTKSAVMDALAEGWGAVDPRGALEAGMTMQDRDYGDEFVMTVAGEWASQSPREAASWAEGLEQGDLRLVSVHAISSEWAMNDPQGAAQWVLGLKNEREQQIASQGMVSGWSDHDPGAALLWTAENLPDSQSRKLIIEDVMLNWAGQTPNEAGEWLNDNSSHPAIDDIITSFTSSILDQDPVSAVAWARTIKDQQKKQQHLDRILKDWISLEPERARNWISASDLPEATKQAMLK